MLCRLPGRSCLLAWILSLGLVKATVQADEPKWEPIGTTVTPSPSVVKPVSAVVANPEGLSELVGAAGPSEAVALPRIDPTTDLERRLREVEERLGAIQADPAPKAPSAAELVGAPPPVAGDCKSPGVVKNPKMEGTWKNALWFESKDKAFRFNVGGVIQYDMAYFHANKYLVDSIGVFNNLVDPGLALQDGFSMRRARLRFAGTLYEQFEFFAQYEFAQALDLRRRTLGITPIPTSPPIYDYDPGDDVGFNEVYVGLTKVPLIGQVRVGRMRESLNFITATADTTQVWMERGMMFDAFNGDFNFSNGITLQNTWLNDRVYALLGWFHSNNFSNRGFYAVSDGDYAYDARLTGLPIYDEEKKLWVHVGFDYSYRVPYQQQLRYRSRAMIRSAPSYLSPNILNTGAIFTTEAQQIANLEFAMACGRFTFAAEATTSWVNNAYTGGVPRADGTLPSGVVGRGTYQAGGGYVEALCFLTPDHRKYRKERPGYERVVPEETFYYMDTERGIRFDSGAWEVGVRYDYLDLTNNGINGGLGNAVTFCVNWYLNPNARVQCNYSWMNREFAPTDTAGRVDGSLQALGIRFNADF